MKLLITTTFFFLMHGLYAQKAEQEITNTEKVTVVWLGAVTEEEYNN
jgi:hypothetical protein